jgi:hypothetical protein
VNSVVVRTACGSKLVLWSSLPKKCSARKVARRANEKSEINLDPQLENTNNFEIRWTINHLTATVLLVDNTEVFCRVGTNIESPVLWSSSPQFVGMIKDYLKMKWQSLEQPREQLIASEIG